MDNLPAPEIIAREIVEDLTAALLEFEAVASALEAGEQPWGLTSFSQSRDFYGDVPRDAQQANEPVDRGRVMYSYIMHRTQISLTTADRELLDAESARTGRSLSALIRIAVQTVYGASRPSADDLAAMRRAFGSWADRDEDSATLVDRLRTGSRLGQGA
ncbi:MAG: ribbon-helix-helix protein, CopG family [Nocardioidaceae bacterium]